MLVALTFLAPGALGGQAAHKRSLWHSYTCHSEAPAIGGSIPTLEEQANARATASATYEPYHKAWFAKSQAGGYKDTLECAAYDGQACKLYTRSEGCYTTAEVAPMLCGATYGVDASGTNTDLKTIVPFSDPSSTVTYSHERGPTWSYKTERECLCDPKAIALYSAGSKVVPKFRASGCTAEGCTVVYDGNSAFYNTMDFLISVLKNVPADHACRTIAKNQEGQGILPDVLLDCGLKAPALSIKIRLNYTVIEDYDTRRDAMPIEQPKIYKVLKAGCNLYPECRETIMTYRNGLGINIWCPDHDPPSPPAAPDAATASQLKVDFQVTASSVEEFDNSQCEANWADMLGVDISTVKCTASVLTGVRRRRLSVALAVRLSPPPPRPPPSPSSSLHPHQSPSPTPPPHSRPKGIGNHHRVGGRGLARRRCLVSGGTSISP